MMTKTEILFLLVLSLFILSCGETTILQGDNPGVISTVAGGGTEEPKTGSSALEVDLYKPSQVIGLSEGDFYFLETGHHRLFYVNSMEEVERIAGSSTIGFGGDGGDAREALFNKPAGLDRDHQGDIYIADTYNHRIRKIDQSGIINTIAGSDGYGFAGDGLPATEAFLAKPADVAVDPSGRFYISDQENNRIRMVDMDGIIQTVGGTGEYSYNGNGILATNANLNTPAGIDSDSQGNVYIAVSGHHRVRMIDSAGKIWNVAGNGVSDYSGDGSEAISASLSNPQDVYVRADGNGFYIADSGNHRIRYVDRNGIIYTVAGNGIPIYNGDGLTATEASLDSPSGIYIDFWNNLLIADRDNGRIRKVPFP
jgi:sugar lactone lactonase YvrE